MAGDIYSKAGADAAFVHDTAEARTELFSSTEATSTFAPAFANTGITYDASGNVASVTESGITTTYTYNADGTVATDTRLGKTRTYTYDAAGNLTKIEGA